MTNPPVKDAAITSVKIAQITQLIKDNQLLTAALVFILWQAGAIAQASSYVTGMC